jgi:alanyl-tRNA synthetase
VKYADVPYEEALGKGALAFFGDRYADRVRVVEVPGISIELCGGTHVSNIGQIGLFKIVSESSVASGIRRIEALTGKSAEQLLWKEYHEVQQIRHLLKLKADEPAGLKVQEILEDRKTLEKQLQEVRLNRLLDVLAASLAGGDEIRGCRIMTECLEDVDADELRLAGQALRERVPCCVGLLCTVDDGKVSLVCFASDEAVKGLGLDAGKLVREAAACVKGGGGGKPELATAGGKDPAGTDKAVEAFLTAVKAALGGMK